MVSFEALDLPGEELWSLIQRKAMGGFWLSFGTVILTVLLELLSLDTVERVLKQPGGKRLYQSALVVNLINHFLFGIPVYVVATLFLCRPQVGTDTEPKHQVLLWNVVNTLSIITIHDFLYYYTHKTMHSDPQYYVHHKYHHKFHSHVPPISANAVSVVEYLVAYVMPFAVAAIVVNPTMSQMNWAVALTSIANLLLHTPRLERLTIRFLPPWLVSTHGHLEHHKRLTANYSAPILNFDWIMAQLFPTKEIQCDDS